MQVQTKVKLPYTITARSITVVFGNRPKIVPNTSPVFDRVKAILQQPTHDMAALNDLLDLEKFIAKVTVGRVKVSDDVVMVDGKKINSVVGLRILEMMREGFDIEPMAHFLDRLMNNPLESSQHELLLWLEAGAMPITPDGCFLAFKAVRHDFKDKHSGTMDNSVGQVVSMPRDQVDPNRYNECSRGLHFCSPGYLPNFASVGDPIMIVKIDPADVVAIPQDYNNQKGRAWRYEVVGQVPPDEVAETFFHHASVVSTYEKPADVMVGNGGYGSPAISMAPVPEFVDNEEDGNCFDEEQYLVPGSEFTSKPVVHRDNGIAKDAVLAGLTQVTDSATAMNAAVKGVKKKAPTEKVVKPNGKVVSERVFTTSDKRTFTESELRAAVKKAGSVRGAGRELDISKSTFQGWWATING